MLSIGGVVGLGRRINNQRAAHGTIELVQVVQFRQPLEAPVPQATASAKDKVFFSALDSSINNEGLSPKIREDPHLQCSGW